jgi:hypothetical protein
VWVKAATAFDPMRGRRSAFTTLSAAGDEADSARKAERRQLHHNLPKIYAKSFKQPFAALQATP